MKHPKEFNECYLVAYDLGGTILKKIDDYENRIQNNFQIKKDFYNIEFVYMHSILLDMAKLISVTNNDKSGLRQLKSISPESIKESIEKFEKEYEKTIEKITSNRNRIISHIDISDTKAYFKMGFSEIETVQRISNYKTYFKNTNTLEKEDQKLIEGLKKQQAGSPNEERYSPSDFFADFNIFKEMVNKILTVASDLNMYYYNLE